MVLSIPVLVAIGIVSYFARSFGLIPAGVMLFLGVLPNPLSAGAQMAARELVSGYVLMPREYVAALRRYAPVALRAWAPGVLISALIILNVLFYLSQAGRGSNSTLFTVVGLFWTYALFAWISIHVYVYPLLMEQGDKRILVVYRNALLMAFSRPLFTTMVTLLWLVILGISAGTGLISIVGLTLGAAIQQNAFSRQFPTFRTSA